MRESPGDASLAVAELPVYAAGGRKAVASLERAIARAARANGVRAALLRLGQGSLLLQHEKAPPS